MGIKEKVREFLSKISSKSLESGNSAEDCNTYCSGYMRYCRDQLERGQEIYGFDGNCLDGELGYYDSSDNGYSAEN